MVRTVVGALLAVVFLGLLFAASHFLPQGIEGVTQSDLAQIGPGFTGTRHIDGWTLVCGNEAAQGAKEEQTEANAQIGRCRMARAFQDRRGQVLLTLAFRYTGPSRALTMIVRFPPLGHKGQYLVVSLGPKSAIRVPVFGCVKTSCVAVGALIPAAATILAAAANAQVVLPPGTDGKQYMVGISLSGLAPGLAGMHRAEL